MGHQQRHATRLALGVAACGLLGLASAGTAGAAAPPAPVGAALSSVTDPVTGLLGGSATPTLPTPSPPVLESPAPTGLPAPPDLPALPGLPGQDPGSQPGSGSSSGGSGEPGASAHAQAPAGDDLAAVDAAVGEFLGVCARVPQGVVPVRADVVVLDRNLIAELVDAGVPLRPLVVPCPGEGASGTPQSPSGPGATGARPPAAAPAGSALPAALAFTGTDIAPTLVLGGGLIALGLAFLRKAHLLAVVR